MGRNHNTDLKDVWQTPSEILTLLEAGDSPSITTDPCAGMDTTIGERYNYTVDDDGLTKTWVDKTFVNPPFSDKTAWLQKYTVVVAHVYCTVCNVCVVFRGSHFFY